MVSYVRGMHLMGEEYDKYYQQFLNVANGGRSWHHAPMLFAKAYGYHTGDWDKTLALAVDFYLVYSLR